MLTLDVRGGLHGPNYAAVHSARGVLAGSMLAVCARYCAHRTVRDAAGAWRYGTQADRRTRSAGRSSSSGHAGGAHWHQQAVELLVCAARIAAQPVKPRMNDEQYAAAVAACADLY